MRVAHVTPYFAPASAYGGPPRSILGLCRALRNLGVEVDVLTTTANGPADLPTSHPEDETCDGIRVHYFPRAFPRRYFGAAGLKQELASRAGVYDLLHVHGLWNAPAWIAARHARRRGIPYVLSPRGMLNPPALARRALKKEIAYQLVERGNLASAALLHATSAEEARSLEALGFGGRIAVIPNGVEVRETRRATTGSFRARLGIGRDAPLLAFLGRIHPIKRLDVLAAALDLVRARRPDAQLAIAGPDEGGTRRFVEPRFARAAAAVHWTGEATDEDKWALLSDSDVLVHCSDSESFGLSVAEALAAGVPVVVTRTCPWEEVEAARCGFWVAQDPGAIAQGVLRVLDDPAEARAMGERGRALARAKYGWDSVARAMADQYASVVRSKAV